MVAGQQSQNGGAEILAGDRFESGVGEAIADGLLRFSLLILTPALLIVWAAAAWFRRRIGEGGYWQFLGLVALIWAGAVTVTRILIG